METVLPYGEMMDTGFVYLKIVSCERVRFKSTFWKIKASAMDLLNNRGSNVNAVKCFIEKIHACTSTTKQTRILFRMSKNIKRVFLEKIKFREHSDDCNYDNISVTISSNTIRLLVTISDYNGALQW